MSNSKLTTNMSKIEIDGLGARRIYSAPCFDKTEKELGIIFDFKFNLLPDEFNSNIHTHKHNT